MKSLLQEQPLFNPFSSTEYCMTKYTSTRSQRLAYFPPPPLRNGYTLHLMPISSTILPTTPTKDYHTPILDSQPTLHSHSHPLSSLPPPFCARRAPSTHQTQPFSHYSTHSQHKTVHKINNLLIPSPKYPTINLRPSQLVTPTYPARI